MREHYRGSFGICGAGRGKSSGVVLGTVMGVVHRVVVTVGLLPALWVVLDLANNFVVQSQEVPDAHREACAFLAQTPDPCASSNHIIRSKAADMCYSMKVLCGSNLVLLAMEEAMGRTAEGVQHMLRGVSLTLVIGVCGLAALLLVAAACVQRANAWAGSSTTPQDNPHVSSVGSTTPCLGLLECGSLETGFGTRSPFHGACKVD